MRMITRTAVLLAIAVCSCSHEEEIGENDPDATTSLAADAAGDADTVPTPDGATIDAATTDGSTTACACDASSCGSRVCGRSDCGFPCGECAPADFCFAGGACLPLTGPGVPCIDAFGDRVWEADEGFRTCSTDPERQQRCTCNGNAPDGWESCHPCEAEPICAHVPVELTCGSPGCGAGDVCCIDSNNTDARACDTGSCPIDSYTRTCDGPEDCGGGVCCNGGGGDPWSTACGPSGSCDPVEELCHSAADCGGAAPFCCPSFIIDVRSCSTSDGPTCN